VLAELRTFAQLLRAVAIWAFLAAPRQGWGSTHARIMMARQNGPSARFSGLSDRWKPYKSLIFVTVNITASDCSDYRITVPIAFIAL
jgi:hypothetical protein